MRKTRKYTETEKKQVLDDVKLIKNIANVARKYNIPTATIHTWQRNISKSKVSKINPDLMSEIKRLTKDLQSKELENNILKELLKKTVQVLS